MTTRTVARTPLRNPRILLPTILGSVVLTGCAAGPPSGGHTGGGEANLALPDLSSATFFGVLPGTTLLMLALVVCLAGLTFGVASYRSLRQLPIHTAMREVSELIYTTCKTYLVQQGRFLLVLWAFIASVIFIYFTFLVGSGPGQVLIILAFSLIGMAGSYGIAWFGIRVNTFANGRTAFASLQGRPYPVHAIPLRAGMSVGMVLISIELLMMLIIMLFLPADIAGSCFIGFAIGES
ncbi:MAG: sodium/proton-translocating pyrophosphatase, partial [Propioniciclava sp.]